VESASGAYDHIVALRNVTLRHRVSNDVPDGTESKPFSVEYAESGGNCVFMKFAGIDSPEDARKYNGWELVVPREYAYALKEGEWYIDDLRNCSLVYENSCESSGVGPAAEAAPVEKMERSQTYWKAEQLISLRFHSPRAALFWQTISSLPRRGKPGRFLFPLRRNISAGLILKPKRYS